MSLLLLSRLFGHLPPKMASVTMSSSDKLLRTKSAVSTNSSPTGTGISSEHLLQWLLADDPCPRQVGVALNLPIYLLLLMCAYDKDRFYNTGWFQWIKREAIWYIRHRGSN